MTSSSVTILDANEAWQDIVRHLKDIRNSDIYLISGFLKTEALRQASNCIDSSNHVYIGTRWEAKDLVSGASDLDCFELAKARGWNFYSIARLHVKFYVLGREVAYVGSANLTNKGFGLNNVTANEELICRLPFTTDALKKAQGLFANSLRINEELFLKLKSWLAQQPDMKADPIDGEFPIKHLRPYDFSNGLMIADCLHSTPNQLMSPTNDIEQSNREHDLSLLGVELNEITTDALSSALSGSIGFLWLHTQVKESENQELYFGELSQRLHDALKDDPSPRRKEVKDLLAILLTWVEFTPACGLKVDRPNYSQRVSLKR